MSSATGVEIYIGDLIEHESERALLHYLLDYFRLRQVSALVFMNVQVSGRQIDAVVITDSKFLVIEAKGYNNAVRGTANGHWQVSVPGGWKKFPNPYRQTVSAANALRDAMRSFSQDEDTPYPSGALVFVPRLPEGSEAFGDFKARACGLAELPERIAAANAHAWTIETWRSFAKHHGIERVARAEAAQSLRLYQAEKAVEDYGSAFIETYGDACSTMELHCHEGNRQFSSTEIAKACLEGHSIQLLGPSGCGKSALAQRIAVEQLGTGDIPLLLHAKDFGGSVKATLDREVALLDVGSIRELVHASRLLSRRLVLIVDGYNECMESVRQPLIRGIRAFARRYQAQLIITSQIALDRADLLPMRLISVPEPDATLKTAIATRSAGGALPPSLNGLLSGISSCLEARLVGELRQEVITTEASRYALFDAYVRGRLGHDASEGIRILSLLASEMARRLSFTLTVRDRDRLVSNERDPAALLKTIARSNVLVQRGDKVSFRHELFFHAFAAEAVVRAAEGQASKVLGALGRPVFSEGKVLIVGAIDDDGLTQQVLTATGDQGLLLACRTGECGGFARTWVRQEIAQLLPLLLAEVQGVDFAAGCGWGGVGFDAVTLHAWSPHQRGMLVVLGQALFDGEHLDAVLEAVGILDQRLLGGVTRLKGDPRIPKGTSIRSALFANAYRFAGSDSPGIALVTSTGRIGSSFNAGSPLRPNESLLKWLQQEKLSHGQKFLLLQLCQGMQLPAETFVDALCTWLPSLRTYPQHLMLQILHQATLCGRLEEPNRSRLATTLKTLLSDTDPLLNTSIFEALDRLGAFEDDAEAYLPVVKGQVAGLLANPDNPESATSAYSVYASCIDHPYSSAYYQAIDELSESNRKIFLRLACIGAADSSFLLDMLISDIARNNDPTLVSVLAKWTDLPVIDTVFQQDAVQTFVSANALLGHHNIPQPTWDDSGDSIAAAAMRACGSLYYWISRTDAEGVAGLANAAKAAWPVLLNHAAGVGAYALYFCERHARLTIDLKGALQSPFICKHYPEEAAEVSREALRQPEIQNAYYPHSYHQEDMLRFCIYVLGQYGRDTDIPFLRRLCDIEQLGRSAIDAIRQLEGRPNH